MPAISPLSVASVLAEGMAGPEDDALARWAACGAMALTGSVDEPPSAIPARVALAAEALAARFAELSAGIGREVIVDGAALLGERAAIAGFRRNGSASCGGATQLLRTSDGWVALSLARVDDVELLDAWLGESLGLAAEVPFDAWDRLAGVVARRSSVELISTAMLLGLPCAALGETTTATPLVELTTLDVSAPPARSVDGVRVVDLSSLWAGPLCAHLLGDAGARIVKVESTTRPDGARSGPAAFFDLLHAGHESVALDFGSADGRRWLRRLVESADIVIEGSRPRALAALGASFDAVSDAGWCGLWVSITGYGRSGSAGQRVAFGDDAAVAGGLVSKVDGRPVFCADAVADPMTGLLAATSVLECLEQGVRGMVSVSLAGTAAHVAAGVRAAPIARPGALEAAAPRARPHRGSAAPLGAHTDDVLRTL